MEKDVLPKYSLVDEYAPRRRRRRHILRRGIRCLLLASLVYALFTYCQGPRNPSHRSEPPTELSIERLQADYATCNKLRSKPRDPSGPRDRSARYVEGHRPYLIRNATIWTGKPHHGFAPEDADAYSWVKADVLMQHGLIKQVDLDIADAELPTDCIVYDARGRQLTAGIVDMHSHTGVAPLPSLEGSEDDNELSSDITPYVRSIDGLNPLDHQIQTIKSGGVTTSLILPGSGNNMGGEAFVIKHAVGKADGRSQISAEDMLADPDKNWRYMKMACGENPKRVYGRVGRDFGPFSRLGEAWYFRHAFEQASALVAAQDDWCNAADQSRPENMGTYLPRDLQWESLGALLRGQVLLNTHCYTIPDLEAFVRHTNEFKFSIRAFHHAHQTYLVPEILKQAYGGRPPAAALFADTMYYKAEAYVASEQAGKILWENGITPVYVSDNPVLNAQHVVFEAAKAYRNGLPYHVALAGVTSASAELLGLGERIGKVHPGFDADVVVWDSDPLAVGAAPVQVWIDGTPQYDEPVELEKPIRPPIKHENYLGSAKDDLTEQSDVIFSGITKVLSPGYEGMISSTGLGKMVVQNGSISCLGDCEVEISAALERGAQIITLQNGHIAPTLTAFGAELGLVEIDAEAETQDGFSTETSFSRAVDGVAFDTKQLIAAHSHGVTKAITAPPFRFGGSYGISGGFSTGASHALEKDAIWKDEIALHYPVTKSTMTPSLSSVIAGLKAKLLGVIHDDKSNDPRRADEQYLKMVVKGTMPLVVDAHSADTIASLLRMKEEVDKAIAQTTSAKPTPSLRLVIKGGAESHLVADHLAKVDVGVVLTPFLAYSLTWDQRRSLTGAPLHNGTAIDVLHAAGVKVAIGPDEQLPSRDLFLSAGIAHANSGGKINETEALAFVSSKIYDMLGLREKRGSIREEFVVFEGSPLEIDGQIRAVADGRGKVSLYM